MPDFCCKNPFVIQVDIPDRGDQPAIKGAGIVLAKRIDFHTHFVPDIYREGLTRAGVEAIGRVPFPPWDMESQFARMEQLRIGRALLSISAPGVDFGDAVLARDLAQATNDQLREYRSRWPGRIGGLATLPLPDVTAAVAELDRLRGSGLEGLILLSSYRGRYWSDPEFAPLLEALNEIGALVLLHPAVPQAAQRLGLTLPPPILEFVFDTTRAVADMIFTGIFDRYPRIRWVLAHLGGALPYLAWRLSLIEHSDRPAYAAFRARGRSVADYLRSLYYDTAVSAGPAGLKAVLDLVGPGQLVFGSDIPFLPFDFAELTTRSLDDFADLDQAGHDAINFGNGQALLAGGGL